MTHDEAQELLGAYALDAVEPAEADALGGHVAGCPRCQAEVASYHEALVALSPPEADPPPAQVWERVAATLREAPPAIDSARARRSRRPARPRGLAAAAVVAATAAAAVLGALAGRLTRDDQDDRSQAAAMERAAAAAQRDATATRVTLREPDGAVAARLVVTPEGQGYFLGDALATLPPGRTYQLWAVVGGRAVSLGVLGRDPVVTGFSFAAEGDFTMALSEEPAGGAVSPTVGPLASGHPDAS